MDLSNFLPSDRQKCCYGSKCYRMNPDHLRWKKHDHIESAFAQTSQNDSFRGATGSNQKLSDQVRVLEKELSIQWSLFQAFEKPGQASAGPASSKPEQNNSVQPEHPNCVVCLDPKSIRNGLILPCAHLQTCLECARIIRNQPNGKCPVCRKPINSVMKVFV